MSWYSGALHSLGFQSSITKDGGGGCVTEVRFNKAAVVVRKADRQSVLDVCAVAGCTKQREKERERLNGRISLDVDGRMEMEQMDGNNLLQGSG